MKSKQLKLKVDSRTLIYLFICVGGVYTVVFSILDGDILLKGSLISRENSPFYFWSFIVFISCVVLACMKWFLESLFRSDEKEH
ncbi:hypothetical protein CXF81_18030 [Glaciecola sp. 33A]|jgi:TRAP-type mannitol/chloroaromatic compound transport system permease large subunit|nr:hypothetical protein CXF81_18030 [Glaciecola sp. 33A]